MRELKRLDIKHIRESRLRHLFRLIVGLYLARYSTLLYKRFPRSPIWRRAPFPWLGWDQMWTTRACRYPQGFEPIWFREQVFAGFNPHLAFEYAVWVILVHTATNPKTTRTATREMKPDSVVNVRPILSPRSKQYLSVLLSHDELGILCACKWSEERKCGCQDVGLLI